MKNHVSFGTESTWFSLIFIMPQTVVTKLNCFLGAGFGPCILTLSQTWCFGRPKMASKFLVSPKCPMKRCSWRIPARCPCHLVVNRLPSLAHFKWRAQDSGRSAEGGSYWTQSACHHLARRRKQLGIFWVTLGDCIPYGWCTTKINQSVFNSQMVVNHERFIIFYADFGVGKQDIFLGDHVGLYDLQSIVCSCMAGISTSGNILE